MNKKGFFIEMIVLIVLLIVGFFWFVERMKLDEKSEDKVCVPASCCHATVCVLKDEAPNCSEILCSMVCSGPLDCGAGYCEYINGECEVVLNES